MAGKDKTEKVADKGGRNDKDRRHEAEQEALLREVEEELRREQLAKLWDRYGTIALAVAVAVIAAVGGFKFWESRQAGLSASAGSRYTTAMELTAAGKADEAAQVLQELSASAPGGYPTLAELQRAGGLVKSGRPLDAVAVYEKIAKDGKSDTILKGFAALQAAALRLGEADFTEMQNRLNDLAVDGGVWRHSARELLGLAAFKAGKPDEAKAALGSLLGDPLAPRGAVDRARVILGSIATAELANPVPATAPAVAPAAPAAVEGPGSAQPK